MRFHGFLIGWLYARNGIDNKLISPVPWGGEPHTPPPSSNCNYLRKKSTAGKYEFKRKFINNLFLRLYRLLNGVDSLNTTTESDRHAVVQHPIRMVGERCCTV